MFEIGDYVKIFCRNGLVEAGKVIEIADSYWSIEGIDKSKTLIINPLENVIAVKLTTKPRVSSDEVFVDVELKPDHYERREDLRAAGLAELHKLRAHEERVRAKELLQSHKPTSISEVTFGFPRFTQPIHKHPRKKTK